MLNSNKQYLDFCCMGHEIYFTEDFQSDEESIFFNHNTYLYDNKISFVPEPFEDIKLEIISSRFQSDKSTQNDTKSMVSLSELSQLPAFSTNPLDKIIVANPINYSLNHTAKVSLFAHKKQEERLRLCRVSKRTHAKKPKTIN